MQLDDSGWDWGRNSVGKSCQDLLQVHRRLSLGQPDLREGPINTSDLAHSLAWKCTHNSKIQGLEELAQPQNLPSLFRSGQRHRNSLQTNCCLPGFLQPGWQVSGQSGLHCGVWLALHLLLAQLIAGKQVTLMAFSFCPFLLPGHLYMQLWKDNLMLTKLIAFAKWA